MMAREGDIPTLPVIRQVPSLRGLEVIRGFVAPPGLPEFRRYNLINGFNGTGKTMLSHVLASPGVIHHQHAALAGTQGELILLGQSQIET